MDRHPGYKASLIHTSHDFLNIYNKYHQTLDSCSDYPLDAEIRSTLRAGDGWVGWVEARHEMTGDTQSSMKKVEGASELKTTIT